MRFAFVGDIALGDHPKAVGFGVHSRYPDGVPASLAHRMLPPGPRPDLFFGNLEFCLGATPSNMATLASCQCRGADGHVGFLTAAGLDVLNVATNHTAQHGHSAFRATTELLRASGIAVVGTPADFDAQSAMQRGGLRIRILAWSDRPRQYAPDVPPYNELADDAVERIRAARADADLVIVSVHWGEEFIQVPDERERRIARSMIDAGASIVVGHHPHVLREVETYRHGVIAYSLGNFLGDMTWDENTRIGGCLLVDLEGSQVRSHRLVPTRIASDYLPTFPTGAAGEKILARIARWRERQTRRVEARGYARVAASELGRHVRATALMMARNLFRYPRGTIIPMLTGPIRNRLGF